LGLFVFIFYWLVCLAFDGLSIGLGVDNLSIGLGADGLSIGLAVDGLSISLAVDGLSIGLGVNVVCLRVTDLSVIFFALYYNYGDFVLFS
jgi:hypothetical protein